MKKMESRLTISNLPAPSIVPHLINKPEVLEAHLQQLQDNQTLESHTSKIIKIFGGIDQITTDYLSSNDIQLTQLQLQHIQQILCNHDTITVTIGNDSKLPSPHFEGAKSLPSTSNAPKIGKTVSKFQESNTKTWRYKLSKSNTYIHYLFSNNIANKIISVLYNIYLIFLLLIVGIVWVIWGSLESAPWNLAYYLYKLILFSILVVHLTFVALTINKEILRKAVRHFLFWYKLIACVQQALCVWWLRYFALRDRSAGAVEISGDASAQLCTFITVFIFSAFDGYQISRRTKIWLGIGLSIIFTLLAVNATFFVDAKMKEKATIHLADWFSVSVVSVRASSLRILSIFLWKQTILTMIKKNQCINIRHSPYIEWVD